MKTFGSASIPVVGFLMLAVAGYSSQAKVPAMPSSDVVTAEVKRAIHTQVEAYVSRDQTKAASILAPDVKTFFHGEPNVVGIAAAKAAIQAQFALPDVKLEVSEETVDVAASGDLAIYHATYRFSFTNPATKKPFIEVGNWVAIFKRQPDGVMRLTTDIVADTPPPASSAS
ncbi:nuclear transport factor 2 family protein [Sphingomonas sp.]|uniref:YybH family protein n=1 Tax=Sphingomonas sp. TaxID=28214 RepID=UPI0025D84024|nr:nuclear transport factor 2 family protein [Sphingomonas sp.]